MEKIKCYLGREGATEDAAVGLQLLALPTDLKKKTYCPDNIRQSSQSSTALPFIPRTVWHSQALCLPAEEAGTDMVALLTLLELHFEFYIENNR